MKTVESSKVTDQNHSVLKNGKKPVQSFDKKLYRNGVKRPLDILISLVTLIVLSPILLIIWILVKNRLGNPVLFKQERVGMNEKIFSMYKFRTMTDEKGEDNKLLPDKARLTPFGRLLRSTSLDELPGLYNVLKGDMSLIGPRPLVVEYLPFYTSEERLRHSVKPGLSGLAQINGRNTSSWEKRFHYDIQYVQNITFKNDVKIVFKTILKIIERSDIGDSEVDSPMDLDLYRRNMEGVNK